MLVLVGFDNNYDQKHAHLSCCTYTFSQVLNLSKYLLLLTASPDAIVRVERTALSNEKILIEHIYFQQQYHTSIIEFLDYYVNERHENSRLLMQVG